LLVIPIAIQDKREVKLPIAALELTAEHQP